MYDTRWPRPGPAMAAVSALVGLLAGVAIGLSAAAGTKAEASGGSLPAGGRVTTTTTMPDAFWTVVLASLTDRAAAEARAQQLRAQGVEDAAVLRQDDFPSLQTPYAVYSGLFGSRSQANDHRDELRDRGLPAYSRQVSRTGGG
jgi:cell division septation protein DedD